MTKHSGYWLTCDSCGSEGVIRPARVEAAFWARKLGWIVNNYRDVCPSCQEKNK